MLKQSVGSHRVWRVKRDPKFGVRSSENIEFRTSNPLVSPIPRVSLGYPAPDSPVVLDVRTSKVLACL